MFGPVLLNILAISRSGYRYGDIDANKEGTYRTFGSLGGNDGYDGRSIRNGRYGDICPYDNEKTFRKKREVTEEETVVAEKQKTSSNPSIFLERLRRDARYYDDRYRDDRYNDDRYRDTRYRDDQLYRDRYDDRYRDRYDDRYKDRYDDRYRDTYDDRYRYDGVYRNRYNNDFGGRSVGGYGRDKCGREICNWEAELECDLSQVGGYRSYGRVGWERENDAYYPRDKYEDLRDYFGTRMRSDDDGRLIITRVRPEDKGVYRCYAVDGNEADFMEIHFYPKFPVDANAVDSRDC